MPISTVKQSFATLVPIRLVKILRKNAEICVLYSGYINQDRLLQYKIKPYQYGCGIMRFSLLCYFSLLYNVYKMARQEQVDIFMNVWAHYLLFPVIIGAKLANRKVVARIAGIPIRKSFKGILFPRKIKRIFGLFLEESSLKMSDHIHAVSNSLKWTFVNRGMRPSKVTVISQGVDTNMFRPMGENRVDGEKRLLFVGRLVENKGLCYAIEAFGLIVNKIGDVKFIIVGEGKEVNVLRRLCRQLDLQDKVQFMGCIDHNNLPELYNSANLLVLTSRSEGLSNVVIEAQACGLPVLGTDVGELPTQLEDGRGSVVPFGDKEAIAKEMIRLLSDDKIREEDRKERKIVCRK